MLIRLFRQKIQFLPFPRLWKIFGHMAALLFWFEQNSVGSEQIWYLFKFSAGRQRVAVKNWLKFEINFLRIFWVKNLKKLKIFVQNLLSRRATAYTVWRRTANVGRNQMLVQYWTHQRQGDLYFFFLTQIILQGIKRRSSFETVFLIAVKNYFLL